MSSYKKDDMRINFHLSTGTVRTCLDHPKQDKTQLFRREIDMEGAAELFQNPRQHTGKGYHHNKKKRKAESEPLMRCSSCYGDYPISEYSKNQRKKGNQARCPECVAGNHR